MRNAHMNRVRHKRPQLLAHADDAESMVGTVMSGLQRARRGSGTASEGGVRSTRRITMRMLARMRERIVGRRTCREVGPLLQTYPDGELDQAKVGKVAEHLEHCRRCEMEADTDTRIGDSLARVGRDSWVHPEDRLCIERLSRFADALGA
jgi:Putative zinc-finger